MTIATRALRGGTLRPARQDYSVVDFNDLNSLIDDINLSGLVPSSSPPTELGFWSDIGSGANIYRLRDRLFVGDAAAQDGKKTPVTRSWLGQQAGGYMSYFDARSQAEVVATDGFIGIAAGSRSSDNIQAGESSTIGVASYVLNNNANASDKKAAWSYYGHAAQTVANSFTANIETDITNLIATAVEVSPYLTGATGTTAGFWLGVGGETAQQLVAAADTTSQKPVSVGLAIVNSAATAVSNRFRKGMVFANNALLRATPGDETTKAIAMALARGHQIEWQYADGSVCGFLRSDGSAASSGIVFTSTGPEFRDASDLVQFKSEYIASAANYVQVSPAIASAAPVLRALGSDTDIDLSLQGKGNGRVNIVQSAVAASVAANFTATHYFAVKLAGVQYLLPCRVATW